jgi:hypothetical protein
VKGERSKVKGEGLKNEETTLIYSGKDKTLKNDFRVLKVDDLGPVNLLPLTLHFRFVTPTRLKFDGSLSPKPEFHILIRNLLRRISLLSLWGKLISIQRPDRDRRNQRLRKRISWWTGAVFKSQEEQWELHRFDLLKRSEPFLPLLLGNISREGTGFGLGKYEILQD